MRYKKLLSLAEKILPLSGETVFYLRSGADENSLALLEYAENTLKIPVTALADTATAASLRGKSAITDDFEVIKKVLRANTVFVTHGMGRLSHKPQRGKKIINLWHGSTIKKLSADAPPDFADFQTHFLVTSPFQKEIFREELSIPDSQFIISAYPRTDYLFNEQNTLEKLGIKRVNNEKTVCFCPTFRASKKLNRTDSDTDFPIIDEFNIKKTDKILNDLNIILLIKIHPLQDDIPLFHTDGLINIRFLTNNDFWRTNTRFYGLLGVIDALITDFSSVFFDFLLTGKPIGFVTEDIESYNSLRGFAVPNPEKYMCGQIIDNLDGLIEFFENLSKGEDEFLLKREKVNALVNTCRNARGNACEELFSKLTKL